MSLYDYYWGLPFTPGTAAPPVEGGTVTVSASTASGYVQSWNATYTTARTGSNLSANVNPTFVAVGQLFSTPNYFIRETFLAFDTSSVPADGTVSSAVLEFYGSGDNFDEELSIVQVRAYDWGSALTTADYIAAGSLGSYTLVATLDQVDWTDAAYFSFASEAAFSTAISKGGTTRIVVCSDRALAGSTPSGEEFGWVSFSTNPPRLTVTW